MTIYDFNEIGKYIAKKTKKETIFITSRAKIENEEFKYIWFVGNVCLIRHKNDNSKKTIQYKTFNGVKNYIDRWLKEINNMLTLPIKKKWFNMILSGEKKEEYREIKLYWTKRFCKALYDLELGNSTFTIYRAQGTIMVKNGYQKETPKVKCFVELRQDYGKTEWGAEPNKE